MRGIVHVEYFWKVELRPTKFDRYLFILVIDLNDFDVYPLSLKNA